MVNKNVQHAYWFVDIRTKKVSTVYNDSNNKIQQKTNMKRLVGASDFLKVCSVLVCHDDVSCFVLQSNRAKREL